MLNIDRIEMEKEKIEKALLKRNFKISFDEVIKWNSKRKKIQTEADNLRANKKQASSKIPKFRKENKDTSKLVLEMKNLSDKIDNITKKQKDLEKKIFLFLTSLPNIPDDDVMEGGKENNKVLKTYLKPKAYDFPLRNHADIAKTLNIIDHKRGIKIAGEGSWIYKGLGARLEWALINFFVDSHIKDGYEFLMLPHMLNYDCGFISGQFPKFENEQFLIYDDDNKKPPKFMLPTAETALVSVHKDEILNHDNLPLKYFSYTPCYRKESGASRVEERGTIRGHQFNKVEMVQYTREGESEAAFEELLSKAEKIMKDLKLHYQVSKLAAGDCSFTMCKTYDIEVWIPSIKTYKEVSSVSNCRDYQARRSNVRYKNKNTGQMIFANTLNASGLATSRLFPAILEQYQQADGSIIIPEVLIPYMNGIKVIK